MKKTVVTIECDSCGKDISPHETHFPRHDVLEISCLNIAKRTKDGVVYAVYAQPLLTDNLYFCNFKCIKNYIKD